MYMYPGTKHNQADASISAIGNTAASTPFPHVSASASSHLFLYDKGNGSRTKQCNKKAPEWLTSRLLLPKHQPVSLERQVYPSRLSKCQKQFQEITLNALSFEDHKLWLLTETMADRTSWPPSIQRFSNSCKVIFINMNFFTLSQVA